MIRPLLAVVAGIGMGWGAMTAAPTANPPSTYQPNADIYEVSGYASPALQTLNPVTQAIKAGAREIRFRYLVVAGCSDGTMHANLLAANQIGYETTGLRLVEDSTNYSFTIRANCGVSQANICGGPPVVACLGRGWPYVDDIDASTIMATFYTQSQISIFWHETWGHALETAAEGYCVAGSGGQCAGSAQFSSAPNYVSYMNTGELSRTGPGWPQNDVDRWERTMYSLAPVPEWGDCNSNSLGTWCWNNRDSLYHWTIWTPTEFRFDPSQPAKGWFCVSGCP